MSLRDLEYQNTLLLIMTHYATYIFFPLNTHRWDFQRDAWQSRRKHTASDNFINITLRPGHPLGQIHLSGLKNSPSAPISNTPVRIGVSETQQQARPTPLSYIAATPFVHVVASSSCADKQPHPFFASLRSFSSLLTLYISSFCLSGASICVCVWVRIHFACSVWLGI